jgi:hypothetical protein
MNSEFKLCAVIPVYKHGYVIKETIQKILSYNVPIIVIDDGNTEPDKTLIKNAVKDFPGVDLISLPKNQGKGWAVIKGLSRAKELGYTHAFHTWKKALNLFFLKQKHSKWMNSISSLIKKSLLEMGLHFLKMGLLSIDDLYEQKFYLQR